MLMERVAGLMGSTAFWTSVFEGVMSPATLYAPSKPYMAYAVLPSVVSPCTLVGTSMRQIMGEIESDERAIGK